MKFSVPTNWQEDLIAQIDRRYVEDVYGKLPVDFVGGGRPAYLLPYVSQREAAKQIKLILKRGLRFNYLLNASCLGNMELTSRGQKKLYRIMSWLLELDIDCVTVTVPYLVQWIKSNFPNVKIAASSFANINSIARAKFWEDIGADEITLPAVELNRNFKLLKAIRSNVKCKLQLIANNNCLMNCPLYNYHSNIFAHSSQSGHYLKGFIIDYCRLTCNYKRWTDPSNFIKGDWIRPEDVPVYEDLGIDKIKLVDRPMTTAALIKIMTAYITNQYAGNLLDLFAGNAEIIVFKKLNLLHFFKYFFHFGRVNMFKLYRMKKLMKKADIYIDNKMLDGVLENIMRRDCQNISCDECKYCTEIAEKIIQVNKISLREAINSYSECLGQLNSGGMFK